jgi:hypothetical protein
MRLPGFTAEASLRRTSEGHASRFSGRGADGPVTPAFGAFEPIPPWLQCLIWGHWIWIPLPGGGGVQRIWVCP